MIALLATAAALGAVPQPTPIGPGAAYRPPAGRPFVACPGRPVARVHVELFAHGRAIVIPAGIGACSDPLRTRTPTGVVELTHGRLVLGDLFRVWGRPFSTHRLLSFNSRAPVRAYVDGRAVAGLRSIPLKPGAEIVVELGAFVPPHSSFLFPPR